MTDVLSLRFHLGEALAGVAVTASGTVVGSASK